MGTKGRYVGGHDGKVADAVPRPDIGVSPHQALHRCTHAHRHAHGHPVVNQAEEGRVGSGQLNL